MPNVEIEAANVNAAEMPTRRLERHCARVAAKAGRFLASARAIIEPEIAYFMELRQRLNAQGKRGGIEGWQRWCEKHFSCDVRTVNRALSAILGPTKEKKKSRKWRKPAKMLMEAIAPAIRLAQRHAHKDRDAADFLVMLETEELRDLIPEPPRTRSEDYFDKLNKERRTKRDELLQMGLHLAHAVVEGSTAVRAEIPQGKKILGIAKHMLEIRRKIDSLNVYGLQDDLSRTPGNNFVIRETTDELAEMGKRPVQKARGNDSKARKASGST